MAKLQEHRYYATFLEARLQAIWTIQNPEDSWRKWGRVPAGAIAAMVNSWCLPLLTLGPALSERHWRKETVDTAATGYCGRDTGIWSGGDTGFEEVRERERTIVFSGLKGIQPGEEDMGTCEKPVTYRRSGRRISPALPTMTFPQWYHEHITSRDLSM
jgi:hypothetical protein